MHTASWAAVEMSTTVRMKGQIRQVCNNNRKKEAVATRSTTTPDTVAGFVGRAGTSGGRIRKMIEKWRSAMNTPKKTGPGQFGLREEPTCRRQENCEVMCPSSVDTRKNRQWSPRMQPNGSARSKEAPRGATSRVQENQECDWVNTKEDTQ